MSAQVTLSQLATRISVTVPTIPTVDTRYIRVDIGRSATVYADPNAVFERFEFMSSTGQRQSNAAGDIDFRSAHMQQINCVVHDVENTAWTKTAYGGLRDGCHFYNNGWQSNLGHAMYDQHESDDETRVYRNCIISQQFAYGLHAFGTNTNIRNLRFERCIFHDCGVLIGGASCWNITFDECLFWNIPNLQIGYGDALHHDLTLTNCYSALATLWAKNTEQLTVENCAFYSPTSPLRYETAFGQLETNMRRNSYSGANFFRAIGVMSGGGTFAEYQQATGFDVDSTFTAGLPTENRVFVYPCSTRPKLAHIAAYNWRGLDRVNADVSALGLRGGTTYRIRNAYNPQVDMTTFVHTGSSEIALPFADRSVALPIGWGIPLAKIDPRFGAFILEEAA